MANTFANVQTKASWVAMKGLDLLVNDLHVAPYFDTQYSGEYAQKFAIGRTLTVPLSQRYRPRTDMTYNPSPMDRPTTTIPIDQVRGIDLEWESIEHALDQERGEERVEQIYLRPAVAYLRQEIDKYCAQFAAQNSNMVVGALATNPSTLDGSSAAAKQLLEQMGGMPDGEEVGLCLPPAVMRAIKTSNIGYFNPSGDLSKTWRSGNVGTADGMDFYSSNSLYKHTAGTWATPSAVTTNGANQSGSSLAINCTSGDTFKQGDKFTITGVNEVNLMSRIVTTTATTGTKVFTVTSDVTATAATATLPIYPPIYGPASNYQNVDALPAGSALLTLWNGTVSPNGKSGKLGLALAPGAFYLASVKLEEPTAVEICKQYTDKKTGISLRFIRQWDNIQSRMTNRFDLVFGCGVGLAEQCSVVIACA